MSERREEPQEFEALLAYLAQSRGFDFTGYKRASLGRRIGSRMAAVKVSSYGEYQDYLEVHPEEFTHLFNAMLINVTSFFRDPGVWEAVAGDLVPRLLARLSPREPVRAWVAGCASGEEAVTLAIVLAEAMGMDAFRERVKIYATDVDEVELGVARHAEYPAKKLETLSAERRERFFEPSGARYLLNKDLRRAVIYGRHNLIFDAPISRVDIVTCRNVLMYFNAETQAAVLSRFNFALREGGFLVMGKAEMLLTHGSLFSPLDLRHRVFAKVPRPGGRERPMPAQVPAPPAGTPASLLESAFETGPTAQVIVDVNGNIALANERARTMFGLTTRDLGRPFADLDLARRPLELRPQVERVYAERRVVSLRDIEWQGPGNNATLFDVQLAPLLDGSTVPQGVSVSFADIPRGKELRDELASTRQELETAYEELQTTNEEFQSTVEELETTNEELQSTVEELETVNEELQSTNEEMQTMNAELQGRSEELAEQGAFLESVLGSLRGGVAVVNRDLRITAWNAMAEELWGLRRDEAVGGHLLNLDIGLPVAPLVPLVRACLSGETPHGEATLDAVNRRGRAIACRVSVTPLATAGGAVGGAILLMEEIPRG